MSKEQFELEFTGYMDFECIEDAREFGYKLEEELGKYTKDNVNLYLTGVVAMSEKTNRGFWNGILYRIREYSRKFKEYYYVEDE